MATRYGYSTRNVTLNYGANLTFEKPKIDTTTLKHTGPFDMVPFTSVEDVKEYLDNTIMGGGPWEFEYKIVVEEDYSPAHQKRSWYYRPDPPPGGYIKDIGTPPKSPIEEDLTD